MHGPPMQPNHRAQGTIVSERESILPTFIERHRHMAVLWALRVCAPFLTALQLLFSWLNTKGKKIQSNHPRMNLLRAELLSDWNFCGGGTSSSGQSSGPLGARAHCHLPSAMPSRWTSHLQHTPPDFLQLLGSLGAVQGCGQTLVRQL